MKILKTTQVREADAYTIHNEPILSIDLMERAATRAASWIIKHFDIENLFLNAKIIVGTGNNGGDGLVIARYLWENAVYIENIEVYIIKFTNKYSEDFSINLTRLQRQTNVKIFEIKSAKLLPKFTINDIIIDGIFGSGLNRPVKGLPANVIQKINLSEKFATISIDIPSGMFGDKSPTSEQIAINADFTLTFEFPFLSFFLRENENYTGNFVVIPIGISEKYMKKAQTSYFLIEPFELTLKKREKFSHKGNFGHGLLLAGGWGRSGAAILAAKAALRTGLGLLTISASKQNVNVIQSAVYEALIFTDNDEKNLTELPKDIKKYTAIAMGPAVGFDSKTEKLLEKLIKTGKNIVLDADALTILSKNKKLLELLPENTILTPHPKEFQRIFGNYDTHLDLIEAQKKFSEKYKIIIVLKTANTTISTPDGRIYFNNTGNPGLATGGSGDVLTGMILGFLAQGYEPLNAALIAVYLHGLSADLLLEYHTFETMLPTDIIENLPDAFYSLKTAQMPEFIFMDFEK